MDKNIGNNFKEIYNKDGTINRIKIISNIFENKKLVKLPSVASNPIKGSARFEGSANQLINNISQNSNTVNVLGQEEQNNIHGGYYEVYSIYLYIKKIFQMNKKITSKR